MRQHPPISFFYITPFGSAMANRGYNCGAYRYGFNGKEKDDEVKGAGNHISSNDVQNLTNNGGHSQIFLNYTYDANGQINGIDVFDNSGETENLSRTKKEGVEYIRGANLLDK